MGKRVSDSKTEQVYVIRPQHINASGRLFGGYLMQWIDEVAGVACRRHSKGAVTAVAVDNLQFKDGAFENDTVVIVGKVTYVGCTSMEVRVDSYLEDFDGSRKCINTAFIVMVALDKEGKPKQVPELELETKEDRMEWEAGKKRYDLRKKRRAEGY